jgi:predicted Zn finger-like uncharacterized protein
MKASSTASAVTRCPHCAAKFRVRAEQVSLHAGLVRCGACRGIFDAVEHLIEGSLPSMDPIDDHGEVTPPQTIVRGMPGMEPDPDSVISKESTAHVGMPDGGLAVRNVDAENAALGSNEPDAASPGVMSNYHWRAPPQVASRATYAVWALLCSLAVLGLIGQSAYFFRDELASRLPALAPSLVAACEQLSCRVAPPKRSESLGFVGTDLAADPAHKGLLVFTATLRNSGPTSVAYPHLVLSLDGLSGELVARRIFSPEEFAPATANLLRGLDAGAEIEVKLYLDASQTSVVGFKVDHAYL